jgi:hypothetical protein
MNDERYMPYLQWESEHWRELQEAYRKAGYNYVSNTGKQFTQSIEQYSIETYINWCRARNVAPVQVPYSYYDKPEKQAIPPWEHSDSLTRGASSFNGLSDTPKGWDHSLPTRVHTSIDVEELKYLHEKLARMQQEQHMYQVRTAVSTAEMRHIEKCVPGMYNKDADTLIKEAKQLKPIHKLILKRKCRNH